MKVQICKICGHLMGFNFMTDRPPVWIAVPKGKGSLTHARLHAKIKDVRAGNVLREL